MAGRNYYALLGVEPGCDFPALRRAYYRRAKECHPDHHPSDLGKAEAFKLLVEAFHLLSDPVARQAYDLRYDLGTAPGQGTAWAGDGSPVLDTRADDILEEMMVGNTIPRGTTLQTLMLDLERTERFMMLREAQNLFHGGQIALARQWFERYLICAPLNILARYYLGRCHLAQGRYRKAAKAFAEAVQTGARRHPPLHCPRIRREWYLLRRRHLGWWSRVTSWFEPPPVADDRPPDEAMRSAMARTMHQLWQERKRRKLPTAPP